MTNKHDAAIADFYTEDASIQEVEGEPRQGRDGLVAREKSVLEAVASVTTHAPDFVAVEGERVAIHWRFEFVHRDGRTRIVDEVALQEWRGDRIARERFIYDRAASAWR